MVHGRVTGASETSFKLLALVLLCQSAAVPTQSNQGTKSTGVHSNQESKSAAVPSNQGIERDGAYRRGLFSAATNLQLAPASGRCNTTSKCERCQGDCDHDTDCEPGLKCYQRGGSQAVLGCSPGGLGDQKGTDYCYDPTSIPPLDLTRSYVSRGPTACTPQQPCAACVGVCGSDNDCAGAFKCFRRTRKDITITYTPQFQRLFTGCTPVSTQGSAAEMYDFCFDPKNSKIKLTHHRRNHTKAKTPPAAGGDPLASLRCTPNSKCSNCQGNCASNADCVAGAVCGTDLNGSTLDGAACKRFGISRVDHAGPASTYCSTPGAVYATCILLTGRKYGGCDGTYIWDAAKSGYIWNRNPDNPRFRKLGLVDRPVLVSEVGTIDFRCLGDHGGNFGKSYKGTDATLSDCSEEQTPEPTTGAPALVPTGAPTVWTTFPPTVAVEPPGPVVPPEAGPAPCSTLGGTHPCPIPEGDGVPVGLIAGPVVFEGVPTRAPTVAGYVNDVTGDEGAVVPEGTIEWGPAPVPTSAPTRGAGAGVGAEGAGGEGAGADAGAGATLLASRN